MKEWWDPRVHYYFPLNVSISRYECCSTSVLWWRGRQLQAHINLTSLPSKAIIVIGSSGGGVSHKSSKLPGWVSRWQKALPLQTAISAPACSPSIFQIICYLPSGNIDHTNKLRGKKSGAFFHHDIIGSFVHSCISSLGFFRSFL